MRRPEGPQAGLAFVPPGAASAGYPALRRTLPVAETISAQPVAEAELLEARKAALLARLAADAELRLTPQLVGEVALLAEFPGVGTALAGGAIAYAVYTSTSTLDRDPNNAADMAITFPGSWGHYAGRADGEAALSASIGASFPASYGYEGTVRWNYPFSLAGSYTSDSNYTSTYPVIAPETIVAGGVDYGQSVGDAHKTNLIPGYGTEWVGWDEFHRPAQGAPGAEDAPVWTNAQRTVTTTRVVPLSEPAPVRWSYRDLPRQLRHPLTEVGPATAPRVDVWPEPWLPPAFEFPAAPAVPARSLDPTADPETDPDTRPQPEPETLPDAVLETPTTSRTRPDRREKERKVRLRRRGVAGAIYTAVGGATELLDAVDAVWSTLDDSCKTGRVKTRAGKWRTVAKPTPDQKAADIYRCFDHLDIGKALEALVKQNISDYAWAQLGRFDAEASANIGRDRGLMFGPWDGAMGKVQQELHHRSLLQRKADRKAAAELHRWYRKSARDRREALRRLRKEHRRERAAARKYARARKSVARHERRAERQRRRRTHDHSRFIRL